MTSTSGRYTITDIKDIFNTYVTSKQLINAHEQQYINVGRDDALAQAVHIKGKDTPEFMKREDALQRIRQNMQTWHEIRTAEGSDPIFRYVRPPRSTTHHFPHTLNVYLGLGCGCRKGAAKHISVVVKMRQGRKAATLITGFEGYGLVADDLAEELRKVCASSTAGAYLRSHMPLSSLIGFVLVPFLLLCVSFCASGEDGRSGGYGAGETDKGGDGSVGGEGCAG